MVTLFVSRASANTERGDNGGGDARHLVMVLLQVVKSSLWMALLKVIK